MATASMDDQALFGRVAYRLAYSDAVARRLVAPLKLVAEQRVDLPETELPAPGAVAQTVRPRRVSMPLDRDDDDSAGGFASFAEEVGANRLPELLEAAAAHSG